MSPMNKKHIKFKLYEFTKREKDTRTVLGTDSKKPWQHLFVKLRTH